MDEANEPNLPRGYRLDEGQPDFVFLIRPDGSQVAVFSGLGASRVAIEEAARSDLRDQPPENEGDEGS